MALELRNPPKAAAHRPNARGPLRESYSRIRRKTTGALQYYADGMWLRDAGFVPGTPIVLGLVPGGVEIRVARPDERRQSDNHVSRKGKQERPVIDITAPLLRELFGGPTAVHVRVEAHRIVLTKHELEERIARRPRDGSFGAAFAGVGLADAAATEAGMTPKFGIEISPKYAELWARNHGREATLYNMSVHEAALLPALPSVETFFLGVCCEPFSVGSRQQKGQSGVKRDRSEAPHQHELLDMSLWALNLIVAANPRVVVIENAPGYAKTDIAYAMRLALARLGYAVSLRVLDTQQHGYLTSRRRTFIVAQTPDADGMVPSPWPEVRAVADGPYPTLGAALDQEVPDDAWFDATSKPWPFRHAERQRERGNGFAVQPITEDSTKIPTIKKRYFAGQGDQAMVAHPTRPGVYRWLTISEVRRIFGVPEWMDLGTSKTLAGEVMGQGVHVGLVQELLTRATGRCPTAPRERPACWPGAVEADALNAIDPVDPMDAVDAADDVMRAARAAECGADDAVVPMQLDLDVLVS